MSIYITGKKKKVDGSEQELSKSERVKREVSELVSDETEQQTVKIASVS